jgi:hypothetical protein
MGGGLLTLPTFLSLFVLDVLKSFSIPLLSEIPSSLCVLSRLHTLMLALYSQFVVDVVIR